MTRVVRCCGEMSAMSHQANYSVRLQIRSGPGRVRAALVCILFAFSPAVLAEAQNRSVSYGQSSQRVQRHKLDKEVNRRKNEGSPQQVSSVIVTLVPGAELPPALRAFARRNGRLDILNGHVLDLPNRVIAELEAHPTVFQVHDNRPLHAQTYRTSETVGAHAVQSRYGLTGAGIGVAVIDAGVTDWHDDLTPGASSQHLNAQRVAAFVDFADGGTSPIDEQGHGTHVAGIIAGNGYDSFGQHAGIAPDASLVALKVLDGSGQGTVSHVIAALDWVLANHTRYNVRVVNLSVGAGISESYWSDPLTLAAKRVVDAGIVVVTAVGNHGTNAGGGAQYGGITAPGNAPWVITVGASSTTGTVDRGDDTIAGFSSRGPTYLDWSAKPDLVAPGHGTISLADPYTTFFESQADFLVAGARDTAYKPYLSLSGTSMAAPVVAGTAALMLQANPSLTPNAVKAILQYTAQEYQGYDALTEGAGFLNAAGAVELAHFFATDQSNDLYPLSLMWSGKIIWGSYRLPGAMLDPEASAFALGTTWGAARTDDGDNVIWGTVLPNRMRKRQTLAAARWNDCNDNVRGTARQNDNIIWGTGGVDNILWDR